MTDKTTDQNSMDLPADDVALKKRLITRVAAAGVLIAILLAGLALLDNLNAPPPKPAEEPPVLAVTEPKPAEAKTEEKAEEKPAEKSSEAAATDEQKKAEEVAATPEASFSPAAPNKKGRPGRVERPLTKPAEPKLALLKPSEPVAAAKPAEPAAELVRPPRGPAPAAPASRPLTHPPGPAGNFLLQMGVFNSTANAEELRAKLELNGIPSQIEARVQVGPFRTRLEAEQMRDKLKQLGMETGMVVAVKK